MTDEVKMLRVFTLAPRVGQKPFWLNVGSAFPHKSGKGMNVLLQALPLPDPRTGECKLIIREYDPTPDETDEPEQAPKSKK